VLMLVYMLMGLSASLGNTREGTPQKGPPTLSPGSQHNDIGIIKQIFFALIIILLLIFSFITWGKDESLLQNRLLQISCGIGLIGLVIFKPLTASPRRLHQIIACLVVFAGYHFTQYFWAGGQEYLGDIDIFLPVLAMSIIIFVLIFVILLIQYHARALITFFDIAVFSSTLLWMLLALTTTILLVIAGIEKSLINLFIVRLIALNGTVMALYWTARFSYGGNKIQQILLVLLGVCMVVHAL